MRLLVSKCGFVYKFRANPAYLAHTRWFCADVILGIPSALPACGVQWQGRVLGDALVTRSPRQEAKRKPVRHGAVASLQARAWSTLPNFCFARQNMPLALAIGMHGASSLRA